MPGGDPNGLLEKAYDAGDVGAEDRSGPPARLGTIRALGIIQIVMGALCVLVVLASVGLAAKTHTPPIAALFYGLAAANLLVTGIGTVRIAPWARRATVISAWIWLSIMVLGIGAMVFGFAANRMGGLGRGELTMVAVIVVPLAMIMLGLPILLIAVLTRPAVRATFERGRQAS
jgi:hypothetical protein